MNLAVIIGNELMFVLAMLMWVVVTRWTYLCFVGVRWYGRADFDCTMRWLLIRTISTLCLTTLLGCGKPTVLVVSAPDPTALLDALAALPAEKSPPVRNLVIKSTPPGASIALCFEATYRWDNAGRSFLVDGHCIDTGAKTPQTIPFIRADKTHTIELHLDGYEKSERRIDPGAADVYISTTLSRLR